jgi:hypothetical protein
MIYPDWLGTYQTNNGGGGYLASVTLDFTALPYQYQFSVDPDQLSFSTDIVSDSFDILSPPSGFTATPIEIVFISTAVVES